MNEMTAHQYFMVRKYYQASIEFEKIYNNEPDNNLVQKKLIICYTQSNRPKDALDLFLQLIKRDIKIIIKTDPDSDDCPCPDLITNINTDFVRYEDKFTIKYVLGILWLYCDAEKSLCYFREALNIEKVNPKISEVIRIIETRNRKFIKNILAQMEEK